MSQICTTIVNSNPYKKRGRAAKLRDFLFRFDRRYRRQTIEEMQRMVGGAAGWRFKDT